MSTNTNENNIALEEITGTYKGTTEYSAYTNLGTTRREITGILGVNKKANAFRLGAIIAKPFSIMGSAFGFATVLVVVAHQELFENIWWGLFLLGFGFGLFLEYLSTANEDSFVGFDISSLTKTGIFLILFVKSYAVFMHFQTSEQIAKALTNGVNSSTIAETPRVANLREDIADLRKDIASKEKEKETDTYSKLLINSASTHILKRNSATASIKAIEDSLLEMKASKKAKGLELATLTENNVDKEKEDIRNDSEGMIWTFFAMLVMFELGGTLLSVLYKKTILNGVDQTIAVTEEVKTKMYSKKASLDETTNKLNSFRVANEVKANHNAITLIELESKVKEDEIVLLEKVRMSELQVSNKELELKVKMSELDTLKHDRVIQAINHKIEQISNTIIDVPVFDEHPQVKLQTPSRTMGFDVAKSDNMTKDDIISSAMNGIKEGDKLPAKSTLIDTASRRQKAVYEIAMKELVSTGQAELKTGLGYFATAPTYDFDLGDY